MKTIAAILVCALTFSTVAPSNASAREVDDLVKLGISTVKGVRSAGQALRGANDKITSIRKVLRRR